ncbi:hypothetical protein RN001_012104 [Aquatica leii]|uniref:Uncharacterized protein n=1 Tax=Aquatica leii TaxID=1421715 RepID=A0AAN7P3D4_9COLE|nr:hypothetical protein RN001_012104 [Aquatica leii]
MKSNNDKKPQLAIPKTEFMKNCSFNFIENERMCNLVQNDGHKTDKLQHENFKVDENQSRTTTLLNRTELTPVTTMTSTESRTQPDKYAPKRYVTKCYFQPKQNPVSYSETLILTLGSNKKHYFDTVMYQTKLVPFRWTETMTTLTSPEKETFNSHFQCFIEEPKYHYMSLEPQQLAAQKKSQTIEAAV